MDYMDPDVPKKADKLNISLSLNQFKALCCQAYIIVVFDQIQLFM